LLKKPSASIYTRNELALYQGNKQPHSEDKPHDFDNNRKTKTPKCGVQEFNAFTLDHGNFHFLALCHWCFCRSSLSDSLLGVDNSLPPPIVWDAGSDATNCQNFLTAAVDWV